MNDLNLVDSHGIYVGTLFGFSHPFFTLNSATIMHTWLVIAKLAVCILLIRWALTFSTSVRYAVLIATRAFASMITQSLGDFSFKHFSFITALFIFIAACNIAPIFPWLEEPTQDLNTTLALGLISFIYTQWASIKTYGFWHYIKNEYFSPILLFPLHIVGKMASVLSISLRLFGNIFGGAIISKIYFSALQYSIIFQLLGIIGTNIIIIGFFTVIEGLLQAFVFTMLSLTYLSIAVRDDSSH